MVSQAFVETACIAFSRSTTLADFHTTKCTDQPTFPAKQNRALVDHGLQCSVVLGHQWRQWSLRYAGSLGEIKWAQAYTWFASAGTRCGLEWQPASAALECFRALVAELGAFPPSLKRAD